MSSEELNSENVESISEDSIGTDYIEKDEERKSFSPVNGMEELGKNDVHGELSVGGIPEKEGESQSGDCPCGESWSGDHSYGESQSGDCPCGESWSGDHSCGESWSGDHSYGESQSGDCSYGESWSGDHSYGESWSGDHSYRESQSGDCSYGESQSGDCPCGESWSGDHSYGESQSGDCPCGESWSGDHSYGESGSENIPCNKTPIRSCMKKIKEFFGSIPSSWKHVIIVFLIIRVLASATAIVGNSTVPANVIVAAEGYSKHKYAKGWELVAGVWERSDALWYLHLAKDGYSRESQGTVFMPLYPLLIRAVHTITGLHWLLSALLISNICFFFALFFLYRLCEIEKDRGTAERAVWYQALYPGSLFLLAPYTESLFLMLATGAFLAARTRRWWLAAIAGAFLGTTRNMGALIIIPLIVEFIRQRLEEKPIPWKNAAWLLIIPLGILSVMAFHAKLTGDPLAMVHRQDNWQRTFMLPWETLYYGVKQAVDLALNHTGGLYIMEAVIVSAALILGIVSFFKIPLPYGIFIWMNLIPPLFAPFRGRMLMSCIRFAAVIFPLFMVIAVLSKPRYLDQAVKLLFAAFYGLSVALYVASQGMF